ncbi:MAG: hypothetical protein DMENIID0003_13810 [Wolbachia endosymbiont of Sergentomyia squamirostris]|uniref:Uncharacterized protein n=1 Tax=Wolbachia endosymbiont of Sergentomyia squamirostris TaxID=3113640 RepID=A0AAT9GDE7_9RICK
MIKMLTFNQDVSDLSAKSKNLNPTRNGFMERSNHMEALVNLYKSNKQVANRKSLCGGIV